MSMFVRVRGATPGDPSHEFDVTEARLNRSPHLFTIVDPVPVRVARRALFVGSSVTEAPAVNSGENENTPDGDYQTEVSDA